MVKKIRFLALVLLPLCLVGCSLWGHDGASVPAGPPLEATVAESPVTVRVADVSNDTPKVFDVDVIGMLWNGIEKSLQEKGMLWTPHSTGEPYVMKAHIVYFREAHLATRLLPYVGRTVLKVRVDITRGGQPVTTIETSKTIGYGKGMWTFYAWRKIFAEVSKDIVAKAAVKLPAR
jgi:hypothetical protein